MNQTRIVCALRTMLSKKPGLEGVLYISCFERPRALTPTPEVSMLRMLLPQGHMTGQYAECVNHDHYTSDFERQYKSRVTSDVWTGTPTFIRGLARGTMGYHWSPLYGYVTQGGYLIRK